MQKEKGNTPIIVANTEWDLPKNLIQDVKKERMINSLINMACPNMDYTELVGWAECVAYLMPATQKAVVRREVSDIYLHCVYKLMDSKGIKDMDFLDEHKKLSDYNMQKLNEFKEWIFKARGGKENNPVIKAFQKVLQITE